MAVMLRGGRLARSASASFGAARTPCTCTCTGTSRPVRASPVASTSAVPYSAPVRSLHSGRGSYTAPQRASALGHTAQDAAEAAELDSTADAPAGSDLPPGRMTMRPYQLDMIDAVLGTLREGQYTRLGVSAPTGSGKTAVFTSLIHRLPALIHPQTGKRAEKVLIVVGAIQLAKQAVETVRRVYPELSVELEQGNNRASGAAHVTVATYQTLAFNELERLDKFRPEDYKAVIIDEAHHAAAPSYLAILSRFDPRVTAPMTAEAAIGTSEGQIKASVIAPSPTASPAEPIEEEELESIEEEHNDPTRTDNRGHAAFLTSSEPQEQDYAPDPEMEMRLSDSGEPCVPLLAFTATWHRSDGIALGKVFEKIVWHGDWLDMIRGKWLSQLQFTTVKLGDALNLAGVEVSRNTREYVMASLVKEVDKTEVNQKAVEAWMLKAGDRRSTLVFCVSISHIISLTNTFRQAGIDARFVHEGIKIPERERLYEAFKRGEFPVLINCGILTEGADFPCIDCVLLARPTRSKNLFLQMIGRGLRLSPETGKENCLVIDLVGNSTAGVVCTPTLFGLDPDTIVEARTQDQLESLAEEQQEVLAAETESELSAEQEPPRRLIYTDYESVFDMVPTGVPGGDDPDESTHVRFLSPLSWIGTGSNVFILELAMNGHVRVSLNEDSAEWEAHFYRRLPPRSPAPFGKPQHLLSNASLAHLLPAVDHHVLSTPTLKPPVDIRRNAGWRFGPASESQVALILAKLAKPIAEEQFEQRSWIEGTWVPGRRRSERVEVASLRKGEASDLISRVKNGAMSEVRRLEKGRKKDEKKREREWNKEVEKVVKARAKEAKAREVRAEQEREGMSAKKESRVWDQARRLAKASEDRRMAEAA